MKEQTHAKAYLVLNAQVYPIRQNPLKIGRHLENHLVLQEVSVSRNHAEILFEQSTYTLHDLNSTSGTFVNNQKISKQVLFSGDIILIANTPLMFVIEEGEIYLKATKETASLSENDLREDEPTKNNELE